MVLKYSLSPNKLKTGKKNSCLAKVRTRGSVKEDGLIDRICYRSSGIPRSLAKAILHELNYAIEDALRQGHTVNLPFVNIQPSIRGQFTDLDDYFNDKRHELCFTVSPGKILKDLPGEISLKKANKVYKRPFIMRLTDKDTGKEIEALKALAVIEIEGRDFVFPSDCEEVGVYVVNEHKRVKVQILHSISTSKILVFLPQDLPEGEAEIQITVRYQHHNESMTCYSPVLPTS